MAYSGRQTIERPFYSLFWFVAAQRGASEYQIAEATCQRARDVFATNEDTSQILAFPLSGPTAGSLDGVSLGDVLNWWLAWQAREMALAPLTAITLHSARETVDLWLKHDHGRWEK